MTSYGLHTMTVPGADPQRDAIVARQVAEGRTCVHPDPDRRGVVHTWIAAMVCAARKDVLDDWTVILQDDADPLPGWREELPRALANSPAPILSLTHFGSFGETVTGKGAAYGTGRHMLWGGAVAYRRDILRPMLSWSITVQARTGYHHDDWMVTAWAVRTGTLTAATGRALFGQPVQKSLLNHNTAVRTPTRTICDPGPDWADGAVRYSRQVPESSLELSREAG